MRKKHPKLTEEIFRRYIEKYLLNVPKNLDEYEILYYESQYTGIMKNLTKDFTEEQLVRFYQTPIDFINLIYNTFGLTRKTNFILFQYNTARISFLQQRGLNPKFPVIDLLESHVFHDKFWKFRVIKKK